MSNAWIFIVSMVISAPIANALGFPGIVGVLLGTFLTGLFTMINKIRIKDKQKVIE